ncbi:MAG: histidine kinase [Vicinamibacterales bacterium]
MAWLLYALIWLTFAIVWTFAGATSSGSRVREAVPFALAAMGSAALMGVGIWRLTGRVPLDWKRRRFYVIHGLGLLLFCQVYATAWMWPDLVTFQFARAFTELRTSPVIVWNELMGSWLYLMIAGIAYAVRAQEQVRAEAAAAAEARMTADRARLAALRAQVNPHFLFNALHTVGALIATDPDAADRALERLGELLRYALDGRDQVPLRDEWRFTTDYLAFERLRLGDRLAIDAHLDAGAGDVEVPPLILQPLVENAVRHGLADRPDRGRISISARVADGRLTLSVRDDGGGRPSPRGSGLGLESIRRRLAATYGPAATLDVDDSPSGFAVTIALPADPARSLVA